MATRSRPATGTDPTARTCNLSYIRRELGRADYSDRRMAAYLQQLSLQRGFPRPLPLMAKGGQLIEVAHPNSQWIRAAVDAWLDGQIPPDCAATIDAQAMASAAAEMDAAARNLRLVGGRDYAGEAA